MQNNPKEVSKDNPCRHCGKPDWCYRLPNGLEVCNRGNVIDGWRTTQSFDKREMPYLAENKPKEESSVISVQQWIYRSRDNKPLVKVVRNNYSDGKKRILQQSWTNKGWVNGYKSIKCENIPIYNYRTVQEAINVSKPIFYVEGEKCCEALANLGLTATTNIGGSNGWHDGLVGDLLGANLILCPDRDSPGLKLMSKIYKHFPDAHWLYAEPSSNWWQPDKIAPSDGYDVADWIAAYGVNKNDILRAVEICRTELLLQEKKPSLDINADHHYTEKAVTSLYGKGSYIALEDVLYRYNGRYYEKCLKSSEQKRIVDWCLKNPVKTGAEQWKYSHANPTAVNNIWHWSLFRFAVDQSEINPPGLNLLNGTLKIIWNGKKASHALIPHSPENIYTYCANVAYDLKADPVECERLLACLEPPEQTIFLRTLAAALDLEGVRRVIGRGVRALLLQGYGNNGKDSLREAARILFGDALVGITVGDCQQYDQGRKFPLAKLKNAMISWSSENTNLAHLDNLQALKAAITGDSIDIELKNQSEYSVFPKAVFLFNCNDFPSLGGGLEALRSRYGVFKFKKTFKKNANPQIGELEADSRFRYDPEFLATLVVPALLNKILAQLPLLVEEGINYDVIEGNYKELLEESNHLWTFCREIGLQESAGERLYIGDLWEQLKQWYLDNGFLEIVTDNKSKTKEAWHDLPNKSDRLVKASNQIYKRFGVLFPNVKRGVTTDNGDRKNQAYLSGLAILPYLALLADDTRVVGLSVALPEENNGKAETLTGKDDKASKAISTLQLNSHTQEETITQQFLTLSQKQQENLIQQLKQLQESNPMHRSVVSYSDPPFKRGQKVVYDHLICTVGNCSHTHAHLIEMNKSVAVWLCTPLDENNQPVNN